MQNKFVRMWTLKILKTCELTQDSELVIRKSMISWRLFVETVKDRILEMHCRYLDERSTLHVSSEHKRVAIKVDSSNSKILRGFVSSTAKVLSMSESLK